MTELPTNLIELINLRDSINNSITNILEHELEIVRKKFHGNGHCIEDIVILNNNKIRITVWYDDWERSRREYHVFDNKYT